jgi:hypothetical protein
MGWKEFFMPTLILVSLFIFIKARRKFGFTIFIVFSCYLTLNFLVELLSSVIAYYNGNNLPLYNFDILAENIVFCYVFFHINNSKLVRNGLIVSAALFLLFWIINFTFIQKSSNLNSYSYLLSCIILSVFSLVTIYRFIFTNASDDPFHNFFFWVSVGILFCYLGSTPYLASFNILEIKDNVTAYSLTIISEVVNSILYLMIITGTLCHRPHRN